MLSALDTDADRGLDGRAASERLRRYGPNRIAEEKPPSSWAVAVQQLRDPMNIMLVIVVAAAIVIGEFPTALIVGLLVLLNVILGARQELAARAGVDALAKMQVPAARVVRDGGAVVEVPAPELVPGDIVHLEAGDLIPAGWVPDMLFQNTSVTRGTATMAVTATGMQTEMGRIATMLTQVQRTRSPLQRELD